MCDGHGGGRDESVPARVLTRRRLLAGALVGGAATTGGVGLVDAALDRIRGDVGATSGAAADRVVLPERRRWGRAEFGRSVEGRPIVVHGNSRPGSRATVLVIATVHGDERGVAPVGVELTSVPVPDGVDAYVVPVANPDGWASGSRYNARGVDLNRNFPWWWFHGDGGPDRASEPETRALIDLVQRLRPTVTVWIHQPYEYVSAVDPRAERWARAWADAAGLPLEPPIRQHGGGESWTYHGLGLPSILVEGTTRDASVDETSAHRRGFEALLAAL